MPLGGGSISCMVEAHGYPFSLLALRPSGMPSTNGTGQEMAEPCSRGRGGTGSGIVG